ncbi:hypothetical protein LOTGIDRAFT_168042 [Lottia gigantea]|uniref:Uncharacterized protein n=1 Tax=Lottia gigantea TaxID=225164 RepID=V3ZRQ5_LOTGI|nr:hypothetical protein LOTGIDRAFT_168042 [Lottia gigantea]ESO85235.1 hypothetical protein LOTGIDRAFT_168042 [Lottia gigantea]
MDSPLCTQPVGCNFRYQQILKKCVQFLFVFAAVLIVFSHFPVKHRSKTINNIITVIESKAKGLDNGGYGKCPNVLEWMQTGKWNLKPATWKQKRDQEKFMSINGINIMTHTRKDNLCGNVSADGMHYFRALCSPIGPKPCCYNNACQYKTVQECQCPDCYDIRELKHAELGTWESNNKDCPLKEFTVEEACEIVRGSQILFMGDSLMRHFHTAMMLFLSGNYDGGALQKGTPQSIRDKCKGIFMYTEIECRYYVRNNGAVCGGTANLTMAYVFFAKDVPKALDYLTRQADKPRSMAMIGIGLHNWLNFNLIESFVKGIHKEMKHHKWPRIVWHGQHYQGLLKSPIYVSQSNENVAIFNNKMKDILPDYNMDFFETFRMTKGLFSFDGTHYGIGANRMKAIMLLHYIKQLKERGLW